MLSIFVMDFDSYYCYYSEVIVVEAKEPNVEFQHFDDYMKAGLQVYYDLHIEG